jgi:hypothetical protein
MLKNKSHSLDDHIIIADNGYAHIWAGEDRGIIEPSSGKTKKEVRKLCSAI